MRHACLKVGSLTTLYAARATKIVAPASLALCAAWLVNTQLAQPVSLAWQLRDVDMSASTDGEDAGVVGAEAACFVEAEVIFAADAALAPVCALRALR